MKFEDIDKRHMTEKYAAWRAVSEEMLRDGMSGTIDCGEASVRADFTAYAELSEAITFPEMLELEKMHSVKTSVARDILNMCHGKAARIVRTKQIRMGRIADVLTELERLYKSNSEIYFLLDEDHESKGMYLGIMHGLEIAIREVEKI